MQERFDLIVAGAGAAGIPAALAASATGAKVLLIDSAPEIGGTFHLSSGQMSAAGSRLQAAKGIIDTPDEHFEDVMRISRGTARADLVRIAVDNAADTLDWLLAAGLEVESDHPVVHFGHEPYSVARTSWAPRGGLAILDVLKPLVARGVATHRLEIRTGSRLRRIILDDDGAACGIVLQKDGCQTAIEAGAVIIATGGYSANASLFARLSGKALFGGGYPESRGDGLLAAQAVGASLVGGDKFLPTFAGVEQHDAPGGITFATQTYPQFRQPWEIYVDFDGRRFVREDEPSVDVRERALLATRDMSFWAIYDERVRREAPSFFIDADEAAVRDRFTSNPAYRAAASIRALASAIDIDPDRLMETIASYNDAIAAASPDPFGREHRPLPIVEPPFYAVRHRGWSIVGFAGIDIDENFAVRDGRGGTIPGLYAIGEAIGLAATSGNAFAGGMSVTPALTFGRLLGDRLGRAAMTASALSEVAGN